MNAVVTVFWMACLVVAAVLYPWGQSAIWDVIYDALIAAGLVQVARLLHRDLMAAPTPVDDAASDGPPA